jgi:hypothetical protein
MLRVPTPHHFLSTTRQLHVQFVQLLQPHARDRVRQVRLRFQALLDVAYHVHGLVRYLGEGEFLKRDVLERLQVLLYLRL